MTAILNNFVTVRQRRGDVLNPAQYRSIVEAIKTVIVKYDFANFNKNYRVLLQHLVDYDNPHNDSYLNFLDTIITDTYAIYVNMAASPLSLEDFKEQIVPSLEFLELIRRIVINRNLYDQINYNDGTVPANFQAYLAEDWGVNNSPTTPIAISYPRPFDSETDFIKGGWNNNTTPFPTILTATSLSTISDKLPVVFTTSSVTDYLFRDDFGVGYPIPLAIASNDLTIDLQFTGVVLATKTLLSLSNGVDVLKFILNPNKTVSLLVNDKLILTNPNPSTDGRVKIIVQSLGGVYVVTSLGLDSVETKGSFVLSSNIPYTSGMLGLALENLVSSTIGLRYLTVYYGYDSSITFLNGLVRLKDTDGSYLYDEDGSYLTDFGVDATNSDLPGNTGLDNYVILTDRDGSYLTDRDGSLLTLNI